MISKKNSRSLEQFFLTVGRNNFDNKIPELSYLWGEGALAEGQGHGPAPVDHEVKPAVLLGHGVALGVDVGVGHTHAH